MPIKVYKALINVSCIQETSDSLLCVMNDNNEEWFFKKHINMRESGIKNLGDYGNLVVEGKIAKMKGY